MRLVIPSSLVGLLAMLAACGGSSGGDGSSIGADGGSSNDVGGAPPVPADARDASDVTSPGAVDASSNDGSRDGDVDAIDASNSALPNGGWAGSGTQTNTSATTDRCPSMPAPTGTPIELVIGLSGDHVLGQTATIFPNRSMLLTYTVPGEVGYFSSGGSLIATTSGLQATFAWPVGTTNTALASTLGHQLIRSSLADGTLVTGFGNVGVLSLNGITGALAFEYDDVRQVFTYIAMTTQNATSFELLGPQEVEIFEVSALTAAQTSKGRYALPAYSKEKLAFKSIVSESDGSYLALMSEDLETQPLPTHWSAVRFSGSNPPSRNAVFSSETVSSDQFIGQYKAVDGSFDAFLQDGTDVRRVHVDALGVPGASATIPGFGSANNHLVGIGGPDLVHLDYDGTKFTVTRFAPDGSSSARDYPAPANQSYALTSLRPQGCGTAVAGLWNTTNDPTWVSLVRTLE